MTNWKTITAKFSSRCAACGEKIEAGEKVLWKKGEKARHASGCGDPNRVDYQAVAKTLADTLYGSASEAARGVANGGAEIFEAPEKSESELADEAASAAFAQGYAALGHALRHEEDAEVANAWAECEGNNPWGANEDGDAGHLLRLAHAVRANAFESLVNPTDSTADTTVWLREEWRKAARLLAA